MKGEELLPQRLRKLREEKGLSQRALSKSLSLFMGRNKQISPSAMCAWETGDKNPSYETLLAFLLTMVYPLIIFWEKHLIVWVLLILRV